MAALEDRIGDLIAAIADSLPGEALLNRFIDRVYRSGVRVGAPPGVVPVSRLHPPTRSWRATAAVDV